MKPLTETGYGVVINADKFDEFISHGEGEGRYFTYSKQRALQHKKKLLEHGLRGKVVKMKVTYEVVP